MDERKPRVLLVNSYVRENAGDAALLSVCVQQVRRAFPGVAMLIAGLECPKEHVDFEHVRNIGSARRFVSDGRVSRTRRLVRRATFLAWFAPYLLLPSVVRRVLRAGLPGEAGRELRAVAEADAVLSIGGGYVQAPRGLNGWQNLIFVMAPVIAAIRESKPVIFMPQSFGPFQSAAQRRLIHWILTRSALVCAREEISVKTLRECGIPTRKIIFALDSGFALEAGQVGERMANSSLDGLRVGVTSRAWLSPTAQSSFEQNVADVIDALAQRGHKVCLIPQVTNGVVGDDDRAPNGRIAQLCSSSPQVIADVADYRSRLDQYGDLDLLIGTRFHSVIFALVRGTPCVAIAYEHKTRGIMRLLGLERWVIDMPDVASTKDLLPLVLNAVEARDAYRAELAEMMPRLKIDADAVVERIRREIESVLA